MTLKKLLASGALYVPYPVKINGHSFKGSRYDFSPICTESCYGGRGKFYCSHGLAHFQKQFKNESLVVCDYVDDWSRIGKEVRHRLAQRSLKDEKVHDWFSKIHKLSAAVSTPEIGDDALAPLHEISRWAEQVNAIAQRMLYKDKSVDFSANFEAASRDMKSLYKASSMLVDAFDYLNIYYNPSSAAFGRRRPVDLYKLVDKIRIILMGAEGAAQNKKIHISGSLRCTIDLFESFKIIPFCLLQNAIKYSFDNDITIHFTSMLREVEMAVESTGPRISEEERTKIFENGYRGEWSRRIHHEGLGVGLYIAKIVADAHNLDIKVRSIEENYQRDGIPVCTNNFSLRLPINSQIERRAIPR